MRLLFFIIRAVILSTLLHANTFACPILPNGELNCTSEDGNQIKINISLHNQMFTLEGEITNNEPLMFLVDEPIPAESIEPQSVVAKSASCNGKKSLNTYLHLTETNPNNPSEELLSISTTHEFRPANNGIDFTMSINGTAKNNKIDNTIKFKCVL